MFGVQRHVQKLCETLNFVVYDKAVIDFTHVYVQKIQFAREMKNLERESWLNTHMYSRPWDSTLIS